MVRCGVGLRGRTHQIKGPSVERLAVLSDGIFAVAMSFSFWCSRRRGRSQREIRFTRQSSKGRMSDSRSESFSIIKRTDCRALRLVRAFTFLW